MLKAALKQEQCNLDLVTLNCVTTSNFMTMFRDHFSIYYIKLFNFVALWNVVTDFAETKSVTKLRLHCLLNGQERKTQNEHLIIDCQNVIGFGISELFKSASDG